MTEEEEGLFSRLVAGFEKARKAVVYDLDDLFNGPGKVDNDFYDELERILIIGDVGVHATEEISKELRTMTEERHMQTWGACRDLLIESIKSKVGLDENAYDFEKTPSMLFLVGVSGVGEATTTGKMAAQTKIDSGRVLLAGMDTFHTATIEQLEAWPRRARVEMIKATASVSPAAVILDACQASYARCTDLLIYGTAGQLHNRKNLMEGLQKIDHTVQRGLPEYQRETLLVFNDTTGQNIIEQTGEFGDICDILGVVLTKLDGSAEGGVAVMIQTGLGLPVKHIGIGEKIDDLRRFDAGRYVEALFARRPDRESEEEA